MNRLVAGRIVPRPDRNGACENHWSAPTAPCAPRLVTAKRNPLKILLSDYSGHPFQVQLARELARLGHDVRHTYSASFQTPKGNLVRQDGDVANFHIAPVTNRAPFDKASFVRRRRQEIEIGEALASLVADFRPDVVISSNAPLDTQRVFQRAAKRHGAKFVFWLQDIYSEAITRVVPRKLPVIGHMIAAWYRHLEFSMLKASDRVVAITEDFVPILTAKGVDADKVSVVENWAPADELPLFPRDNPWAVENLPAEGLRIVYSGTLGYKHNPGLLVEMARRQPGSHVLIYSEGPVAEAVAKDAQRQGLTNLSVKPWVAFADLPKMLSASDVLIAVIEPEAGVYSVPSKILTYLAVGRPILASVPSENLAARLIRDNDAGFTAPPGEDEVLLDALDRLAGEADLRKRLGDNGRAYAAKAFDITRIGDRFLEILK